MQLVKTCLESLMGKWKETEPSGAQSPPKSSISDLQSLAESLIDSDGTSNEIESSITDKQNEVNFPISHSQQFQESFPEQKAQQNILKQIKMLLSASQKTMKNDLKRQLLLMQKQSMIIIEKLMSFEKGRLCQDISQEISKQNHEVIVKLNLILRNSKHSTFQNTGRKGACLEHRDEPIQMVNFINHPGQVMSQSFSKMSESFFLKFEMLFQQQHEKMTDKMKSHQQFIENHMTILMSQQKTDLSQHFKQLMEVDRSKFTMKASQQMDQQHDIQSELKSMNIRQREALRKIDGLSDLIERSNQKFRQKFIKMNQLIRETLPIISLFKSTLHSIEKQIQRQDFNQRQIKQEINEQQNYQINSGQFFHQFDNKISNLKQPNLKKKQNDQQNQQNSIVRRGPSLKKDKKFGRNNMNQSQMMQSVSFYSVQKELSMKKEISEYFQNQKEQKKQIRSQLSNEQIIKNISRKTIKVKSEILRCNVQDFDSLCNEYSSRFEIQRQLRQPHSIFRLQSEKKNQLKQKSLILCQQFIHESNQSILRPGSYQQGSNQSPSGSYQQSYQNSSLTIVSLKEQHQLFKRIVAPQLADLFYPFNNEATYKRILDRIIRDIHIYWSTNDVTLEVKRVISLEDYQSLRSQALTLQLQMILLCYQRNQYICFWKKDQKEKTYIWMDNSYMHEFNSIDNEETFCSFIEVQKERIYLEVMQEFIREKDNLQDQQLMNFCSSFFPLLKREQKIWSKKIQQVRYLAMFPVTH